MYEFHLPNLVGVCGLHVIKSPGLGEWQVREGLTVGEMSLSVFQPGHQVPS